MINKLRLAIISILLCVMAIHARQAMHKHAGNDDPGWSELRSSMERMHMAMESIDASSNSDVDFVRLMIPHHQGAVDMAKAQLLFGKDPQMCRLAQEIITDQQSEIELMNLWLKEHGYDTSDAGQRKPTVHKED
jgi:uncharacterized protein (DUF305 family)